MSLEEAPPGFCSCTHRYQTEWMSRLQVIARGGAARLVLVHCSHLHQSHNWHRLALSRSTILLRPEMTLSVLTASTALSTVLQTSKRGG